MSRRLLIMRHAKSAWNTDTLSDYDRPLARRGLENAPFMAKWLRSQEWVPDYVVSSPALRAKQTTLLVCQILNINEMDIKWQAGIYGADTEELIQILRDIPPSAKMVLLVGHNPGLELLLAFLTGTPAEKMVALGLVKTASVAHLELPDDWRSLSPGCGSVVMINSPKQLAQERL